MPFSVSCPACSARFSLGDDLYRRKVAGNLVTVKCRHCSAEIAVDATDPVTKPSQEAPRRGPSPPRPKGASVTKMGLGLPAPALAGQSATATPLATNAPAKPPRRDATATPFPQGATATPLARRAAPKPAPVDDVSIWDDDDDQTLMMRAPKVPPPRPAAVAQVIKEEEPELIDAEEIPISSSGTPTLDALKLEAARPELHAGKRAPDDFLVNLSAGTQGILGAPTIDISALNEPPPSSGETVDLDMDLVEAEEVAFSPPNRSGHGGTVPLFDMSAVLPAASDAHKASSSASTTRAQDSDSPASVSVPAPEGKARERKFVVAPETPATPKSRRAGAMIWFGLVAAAAGVVAVVGLRGHQSALRSSNEPAREPSLAPVATEAPKAAIAEPLAQDSVASEAPSAASEVPSGAPPTLALTGNAKAISAPATTTVRENVKPEPALEKPAPSVEPAAPTPTAEKPSSEKPATPSKPVEVHNAPPPAADGTEFDRGAARNALASAAAQASACRKDGDPSGTATITITFAPSGRITSANLQGPPFAGTATGGCIANTMRRASVPAFSGEHVTVTKTIVVQ